jgi:hypothetical protein
MINADVINEFQLYARLPLFAFIVLSGSGACVLLLVLAYYLFTGVGGRFTSFISDALVKFRWPIWVLITTDLFLISNHLLVRGLAVGIWDVDGYFYPYYVLVADYARAGRFVYWNPWANAGLPILGDPTLGIFSPLNFIIGLITGGTSAGFIFYWLLMWWLGGFGMFMLARHLQAPAWGGCVVALGFLFCGAYTGNAEHTPWITSFSFLPLIIWRLDSALALRKLRPACEAGALWGLSALAGYPGLIIITGCFSALWVVGRWTFPEFSGSECESKSANSAIEMRQRPALWCVFCSLVLMLLIGVVVLLPAYVAFFVEGAGTHERVGALSRQWLLWKNSLHPGALSTFASPYLTIVKLYDHMSGTNQLWPYTDVSSASIYAGTSIPVLALFALLRRPRHGWRWWLVGLGALSLACALGQALPLRGWLYDWFYPMRFFRNAAIFRFYYLFAVSVLALLATRDLDIAIRHSVDRTWSRFLAASLCVTSAALFVFVTFTGLPFVTRKIILILGSVHALWVWLGVCCAAFIGWRLPSRSKQWALPVLLLALAGSDAFLTSTLSKQTMINTRPDYVNRWQRLDKEHSAVLDLTHIGLLREEISCYPNPPCKYLNLNNDQLITKIPVFNSYIHYNDFHRKMVDHPILKRTAVGAERIWFSRDVGQVQPTRSNFEAFVRRTEILGEPPIVVHAPEELLRLGAPPTEVLARPTDGNASNDANAGNADQIAQIGRLPAPEKVAVDLVKYLPDELVFNVQCPTDGWLLVTDRWARSWRAEVNGKPVLVYGGNFIFRAVQVSQGQNSIRFTYHPFGFPWLVVVSWGVLGAIGIWSASAGIRGSRTSRGFAELFETP